MPYPRSSTSRRTTSRSAAAGSASCTRPRSAPASCWRAASPGSRCSRRSCPEYSEDVGFAGSGGLFAAYSVVCLLLRLAGARWLERLGVRNSALIAFTSLGLALTGLALFPDAWALWVAAGLVGFASAFLYPSLMALTVNQADERERPLAISSFTMFFEVGNISGGVVFGLIAQLGSMRAAFGSAVGLCVLGTWLLVTRVVPRHVSRRAPAPVTGPVAVVVD